MHTYLHILLLSFLVLLGGSCMKDPGNYQYDPINRISITGIDSSYTINYGNKLQIKPVLSFTRDQQQDTANYSCMWVADHVVGYVPRPKTISTARYLDQTISLDFGTYYMYYRVTDKRTNVFTDAYFYLTVGAPSFEGWLLLCDMENGNSRLDMVSHQGNKDTVYPDILKTVSSSFVPAGKPVFVETGTTDFADPRGQLLTPFIATSQQFVFLGSDTLDYKPANDMQSRIPGAVTDWSHSRLYMGQQQTGLFALDNDVFLQYLGTFTGPVNNAGNHRFNASRWLTFNRSAPTLSAVVLFDTDKGAFYRYPGQGTACVPYTDGTLFDFTTGKELLYLQHVPFNGGEVFAVLQDKTDGKRYLARFTIIGTQRYYGEITGDGIAAATQFAVSPDKGYLFYAVGGKLYEYDVINNRCILIKDYGARMISVIKFQQFTYIFDAAGNKDRYLALAKKLVVCTYTPGAPTNSGMLDIYNVPDNNAPLQLYQSFSGGIGKVASVSYRDR
ncbi:hypothetical protein HF329_11400 [Chitinophaga oryzae]|uniref:PKD-like family protein n=1 Tax=Chitinophaga oryzae TaxID=2725414 RepID=A0AAE6ZF95_9BACT|nr:PKD-like family lipoprotein [Chitinophaga oryzae]QJB31898.1 hypothetical protein HF329_11400 [Chitinophaga oryzae]